MYHLFYGRFFLPFLSQRNELLPFQMLFCSISPAEERKSLETWQFDIGVVVGFPLVSCSSFLVHMFQTLLNCSDFSLARFLFLGFFFAPLLLSFKFSFDPFHSYTFCMVTTCCNDMKSVFIAETFATFVTPA